jgi:tetratricopeptide (TPR) repeat protein
VHLDPSYTPNRIELAGALLESGSLDKSEAAFRSLSEDEPRLPKAWQGLAVARLELSREASEALDRLAPESSFRFALAALASAGQGNLEQARSLYRKALAAALPAPWLEPELAALSDGAKTGPDEGRDAGHPLALAFFSGQMAHLLDLSSSARDPEALYWRSRAYAELARIAVQRLSSLPPSAERHELLAVALQRSGRRADAVAEWREASRMSPADRRIRGELARSLRLNRQYDEAVPLLDEMARLDPARAEWQFELGDCLSSQGHPEQALAHLTRAVELRPAALAYRALLGQVLFQSGNVQAAAVQLEKAASVDRDGSIHFQLANAYRSLGKLELSRHALVRQKELQAAAASR